ncbi:MAG: alpha-amylase family glycosyl hydrolase, partial [Candidatus Promineifilaceae bacterium]|nr:alpha-amylase family glycosyl hydrolase [Candidatus Promineifilaceae bacterium]
MPRLIVVRKICLLCVLALLVACAQEEEPKQEAASTAPPAAQTAVETEPPSAPTSDPQTAPEATSAPEPEPETTAIPFDNLHVPSPEWQDQIIYFLMTDRFFDGDPSNNDQGAEEYDPQDFSKYNGGDLNGILQKLDYIAELGATAVWITPPVSNQWWDPLVEFGGYHGYWAENFTEVDPHLGTLYDYQALSAALHSRDMYLIQDIVTNHTGNFFTYQDDEGTTRYNANDPAANVRFNTESVPISKPSQPPFDRNDVTDAQQREESIYNWTPAISDFNDESQILTYQLSDLDDLNTTNLIVRDALKQAYAYWIETVGVDGFRVDTIRYVEQDFWHDFEYSADEDAPGMTAVAAGTGREDFLTFGEAFLDAQPLDDAGDRAVAAYMGTPDLPGLDAVLHFPLHWTINRVFVEGQPTNYMTYRLNTFLDPTIYQDPTIIPTFIDNHDVARFLSKGNLDGFKQANMLLMTI